MCFHIGSKGVVNLCRQGLFVITLLDYTFIDGTTLLTNEMYYYCDCNISLILNKCIFTHVVIFSTFGTDPFSMVKHKLSSVNFVCYY